MRQSLDQILQQLHDQLASGEGLDQQQREKLRQIVSEIQKSLDGESADSAGLASRLIRAAEQFEHSHPELTNSIGRIADLLGQFGI